MIFLDQLAECHVSYYHHLASVVVDNLSNSSLLTQLDQFEPKYCLNIPWGILHRTVVGIFDLLKNMAAVTRTQGSDCSLSHISPKPLGLAKS